MGGSLIMAAPVLSIAHVAFDAARTFDLTSLTGGYSGDIEILGATGKDYQAGTFVKKGQGGEQLTFNEFPHGTGLATFGGAYMPYTTVSGDLLERQNEYLGPAFDVVAGSSATAFVAAAGQAGVGVEYPNIDADQSLRVLNAVMFNEEGTWTVYATLGDGSMPPVQMDLPNNDCWFSVTYRSVAPCKLNLKVLRRVADGAQGYIKNQLTYIGSVTPAPQPRGAKNAMRFAHLMQGGL